MPNAMTFALPTQISTPPVTAPCFEFYRNMAAGRANTGKRREKLGDIEALEVLAVG